MARSLYCLRCCPWVSSAFLWCTSSPRFLPPMKTFGVEPVSSSLCSRPRLVPGSPRSWCCCSPYLLLLFGGVCAPGSCTCWVGLDSSARHLLSNRGTYHHSQWFLCNVIPGRREPADQLAFSCLGLFGVASHRCRGTTSGH